MRTTALLALLLLLLLLLLAPVARAGDAEAERLLAEAKGHWSDATPDEAFRLAEAALDAQPTTFALEVQVHLFLGSLHQAKTGTFDEALVEFDQLVRALFGVDDPLLRQLKADAMVRKGTILYAEKKDAAGALQLYQSAHRTFQLAATADSASQLAFRMGRDPGRSEGDRRTLMDLALGLAREAVTLAPRQFPDDEARRVASLNRYRLQLALVLTALGQAEDAKAARASIELDRLGDAGLYQLAVLRALEGDADGATELLSRSLHLPIRATPASRNALRRFVRTEPDLAALRARPDWKELVTDEPEETARARRVVQPRPLRLSAPAPAPTPPAPTAAAPTPPPAPAAAPPPPAPTTAAPPPAPPPSTPPAAPAQEGGHGRSALLVVVAIAVILGLRSALRGRA